LFSIEHYLTVNIKQCALQVCPFLGRVQPHEVAALRCTDVWGVGKCVFSIMALNAQAQTPNHGVVCLVTGRWKHGKTYT